MLFCREESLLKCDHHYDTSRKDKGTLGVFYRICHLRHQYHRVQGPDKQPFAIAHCLVFRALAGSGGALLAPFVFLAEREGGEEGHGQDTTGLAAGFLRDPSHLPDGHTGHHADGLLHRELAVAHLHDVHCRLCLEGAYHLAQVGRCAHQFLRHHLPDFEQRDG